MGIIENLTKGKHGFHVHEKGDLGNQCKAAGGHFNPNNKNHGDLTDTERHEGDFGNIEAEENNTAKISITSTGTDLDQLIGRAIVVHEKEDDLGKGGKEDSVTTGAAGARLDCCVIQWEVQSYADRFSVSIILGLVA